MKRTFAFSLTLCLLLCLSPLGLAGETPALTIQQVAEANRGDVLFAAYDNIQMVYTDIFVPEGWTPYGDYVTTYTLLEDGSRAMFSSDSELQIAETREYMLALDAEGAIFKYFPLDGAEMDPLDEFLYITDETEEIVSQQLEGGQIVFVTQYMMSDWYEENYGVTGGVLQSEMRLNPDTLMIEGATEYHVAEDGLKTMLFNLAVATNVEFTLPEYFLQDLSAPAKERSITFVVEPGAAEEASYTFTVPADYFVSVITERPYALYDDEACTIASEPAEDAEPPAEKTVYLKYTD